MLLFALVFPSGIFGATPNVIVVICDDLNDSVEGFGGHPQAITPNMDRLATSGVKFLNAQCNVPVCGPSRSSLWSGLYPHTTGDYGYNQQQNAWRKNPILRDAVTVFENMTKSGYQVFATGKIHHNGHEDWSIFEDKNGVTGFKVPPSMGPYPAGQYPEYKGRGNTHPDMPLGMRGVGWDSGFGAIRNITEEYEGTGFWKYEFGSDRVYHYETPDDRDLMPDEASAQYAAEILSQKHDKPFFLTVGLNRPHSPLHVPEKYFELYSKNQLLIPPQLAGDIDDVPTLVTESFDVGFGDYGFLKYKWVYENGGHDTMRAWLQAYLACVTFLDDQLGVILDALDKSAYAENTIVIFTSDHGHHMGEKRYLFKNSPWEESTRVPLVVSGPGISSDVAISHPVSLIDIYPTLVDYCDLEGNPNKLTNGKQLDGYSLRSSLENPLDHNWEGPAFALTAVASSQHVETNQPAPKHEQHYSIRSERYRYIHYRDGSSELYDHLTDPHEWYNLAGNEQYSAVVHEHRSFLEAMLK